MDFVTRLNLYNFYKDFLKSYDRSSLFENKYLLGKGGQGNVYKLLAKNEKSIAVKEIKLTKHQSKYINNKYSAQALNNSCFIELSSKELVTQLVLQKICPHFVITYAYEFDINHLYLFNEFIPAVTFKQWSRDNHSNDEWNVAYFQITIALYSLNLYFNMTHLDLWSENVLVMKIKPGGCCQYNINGDSYYVPNLGYMFFIIDFGHAYIKGKFESKFIKGNNKRYDSKKINAGTDLSRLIKSASRLSTSQIDNSIRVNVINKLKSGASFESVIKDTWYKKYSNNKYLVIDTYDLNKKLIDNSISDNLKVCIRESTQESTQGSTLESTQGSTLATREPEVARKKRLPNGCTIRKDFTKNQPCNSWLVSELKRFEKTCGIKYINKDDFCKKLNQLKES